MVELFKIVRGNAFPLKIYVSSMSYNSSGRLVSQTVDLRTVRSLQVYAFSKGKNVVLPFSVSQDGTYLTATIYNNRNFRNNSWGIKVTGIYNNLNIAATEHRVFKVVACNALSYIPYGVVEGEHSYMYNLKFASGDTEDGGGGGDDPQPTGQSGWIGFKTFNPPEEISTSGLTPVDSVIGTYTWTNNTEGARFVVISTLANLSFTIGGLPGNLLSFTQGGNTVYYSDPLQAKPFTVKITNG